MNTGAFGEGFPYTNFHDLNMDWIIKIAKDFLDQYTHIQDVIAQGLQDLDDKTQEGLQELNDLAGTLEQHLNDWYDTHSEDIANQLTSALQDLNNWYTEHQGYLDQYITDSTNLFHSEVSEIINSTLESLPADYTSLAYNNTNDNAKLYALQTGVPQTQYMAGFILEDAEGYMTNEGTVTWSESHSYVKISDTSIKQIIFPQFSSAIPLLTTAVVKNGNTVVAKFDTTGATETVFDIPNTTFTDIYINWWYHNTTPIYNTIKIGYAQIAKQNYLENGFNVFQTPWGNLAGQTKTFKLAELMGVKPGFIIEQMLIPTGTYHRHITFPARYIKKIVLNNSPDSPAVANVLWYKTPQTNGYILIDTTQREYEFQAPWYGYIGINIFSSGTNQYPTEATITFWDEKDIEDSAYYFHSVKKPFSFNGKTAEFIGTSITAGFTSGSTTTQNNYPKLFSEHVGFSSYHNGAYGGACFVSGLNSVRTIPEQLEAIQSTPDFLFIEGGTNDCMLGASISAYKGTIRNLCTDIKNRFPNTKVIFITAIPTARTIDEQYALGYTSEYIHQTGYNKALTEVVHEEDNGNFSIVQSYLFGFPNWESNPTFISAMFGDKLHPSELGYKTLFYPGLCTALL